MNLAQPQLLGGFWNRDRNVMRVVVNVGELRGPKAKLALVAAMEDCARKRLPESRVAGVAILLTFLVKSLLADQWVTFGLAVGL